jgi:preprotein translocase subunit SecG
MYTAAVVIHIIVCLFLIFVILIQSSKGAEIGAAFGGSNQTLFGSRGAATFLSKVTTVVAILFMITSLSLAIFSIRQESVMSSVSVKELPSKPVEDSTTGPLKEQTAVPGHEGAQDIPSKSPEKSQ